MSALRYRTLLTNLPNMASVVNSFNSPVIQQAVYEALIAALNGKMDADGVPTPVSTSQSSIQDSVPASSRSSALTFEQELAHDLVEGESIHAVLSRN